MLKNEELKQINKATIMLEVIEQYAINTDTFCEDTGITIIDIVKVKKALTHLHTKYVLERLENTRKSNEYKKIPKNRRRATIIQNINNAKHNNDQKKIDYWTKKLEEYKKEVE